MCSSIVSNLPQLTLDQKNKIIVICTLTTRASSLVLFLYASGRCCDRQFGRFLHFLHKNWRENGDFLKPNIMIIFSAQIEKKLKK
jgi:hypothetical protein